VQGVGEPLNSELLAQLCTQYVSEETGLKARDLVERSKNLHIIKYCKMPMALVEFGFMSNRKDLSIILKEESQRGCARAIYKTIEEAYTYLENETTGE
jgi:N-acetylmuramoyl-L-alanine amidase